MLIGRSNDSSTGVESNAPRRRRAAGPRPSERDEDDPREEAGPGRPLLQEEERDDGRDDRVGSAHGGDEGRVPDGQGDRRRDDPDEEEGDGPDREPVRATGRVRRREPTG